jgi:hypothetical protein
MLDDTKALQLSGSTSQAPSRATMGSTRFLAAAPPTRIRSTFGRIGLFQAFDAAPFSNPIATMSPARILQDAHRYDTVWGATQPSAWNTGNPGMLVSRYFILEDDRIAISGHTLAWWQTSHPDWILYTCDPNGNPTRQIAYAYSKYPEVPLDFHNPAVVDYQIRQLMAPNAIANGYSSLSADQVIFNDFMVGGNPTLGQTILPGYYACGIWEGTSFVRRYSGKNDPAWTADIIAWLKSARNILSTDPSISPYHLALIVNHPIGSTASVDEQQLLATVDATLDEAGFSNYGNYQAANDAGLFKSTVSYMRYAQKVGVAVMIFDKFSQDTTTIPPLHLEYSIATYLMGNEQAADLYVSPNNNPGTDGAEQYHPEYQTQIGSPCGEYYGGPSYDPSSPQIFYRKFSSALIIVNSGSLPRTSETAHLPLGHAYTDLEGRAIGNPLVVNSNDARVLLTSNGCL